MKLKLFAKEKRTAKPVFEIIETAMNLNRKELDKWEQARRAFLNPDNPLAYLVQHVYNDAMLDAHLAAITRNRLLRMQNKRFIVRDNKGEANEELSAIIRHQWFNTVIEAYNDALMFGWALISIENPERENFRVELLPRDHVMPQQNLLLRRYHDTAGMDITEYPQWLILIRNQANPMGILEKAVPLTIFKRHSWSAWERFEQLFGVPLRVLKTAEQRPETRRQLKEWLRTMGLAGYAMLPVSTELEIVEREQSDAFDVFYQKLKTVNEELSKLVNGQTMTVDQGSSRSQSEVHLLTEEQITQADIRNFLFWANDTLIKVLIMHGFKLQGCLFDVENTTNQGKRIEIDSQIMQYSGYRFTKEYLENTYNIQIEEEPRQNKMQQEFSLAKPDYDFFD